MLNPEATMRPLNYDMLNIVIAVQRLKSFMIADSAIREAAGQESPSWFKSADAYYSEIPDSVTKVAGLHKNRSDFEKILAFQVTDEMMKTNIHNLSRFQFPADDRGEYPADSGAVKPQA
jgi:glutaredoxin-related protein